MRKKQLARALTIAVTIAITIESLALSVTAKTDDNNQNTEIVVEIDPGLRQANDSASTVNTATQDDARSQEAEDKANNPSEYEKVGIKAEDDSTNENEEESVIEWEEVHISTSEELVALAKNCSLDSYSANKKVYLDADISMSNIKFEGIPYFNGYFYGQNHEISNINISENRSYLGFFSMLDEDAYVTELKVSGSVTPSGAQTIIGGIAGDNKGVIAKCTFNGTVSGEDYIGGITGINELSGIVIESNSQGVISGTHFTGGISGANMGNIISCTNEAGVNIVNKDSSVSVEDISVDSILSEVGLGDTDKDEAEASAMVNGVVDTGGISGLSIGVIQDCENKGEIGYQNVGYNVGGIAGRQSGYIVSCRNFGKIKGRKDVGGIVGQAEPYVTIDFENDITTQLSYNIEKLHDILTVTLNDADKSSDIVSQRLAVIKTFTDQALTDVRYLENESIDWANSVVATANEAISRADYIMDEAAKKDGVMDKTNSAASDAKTAMGQFEDAVEHLDLYSYMDDSEKQQYDAAKKTIIDATDERTKYVDEVYGKMYNYYIDEYKYTTEYADGTVNEKDLAFKNDEDGEIIPDAKNHSGAGTKGTNYTDSVYAKSGRWVHCQASDDGKDVTFPGGSQEQITLDNSLVSKASQKASTEAGSYADAKYLTAHGSTYVADVSAATEVISSITLKYSDKMSADAKEDATKACKSLKSAATNVESAGTQAKGIIDNINSRGDLALPSFSGEYKQHANSLTNNLQGMSDNFGILNQEMNGSSDTMINDLKDVNDQFNVIMLLFTDAVDGVLDNDYTDSYEDNSLEVCRSTTDATIDSCTNKGTVEGSINVSGICGTMAIEYDFDLESDVTGVKNAATNKRYLTKCVLRDNVNYGKTTAEKNYVGGVCGLQEMGTITGGQNYALITSSSASYVGGISGSSVSSIVGCFSKCSLSGESYVGGITGDGTRIYDSLSMVTISDATEWYGAVSGHVADDADIKNNYFVGDSLAGIDRVSYSGKAEPVNYHEAEEKLGVIPAYFKTVTVSYMLDTDSDSEDDEPLLLKSASYSYGQSVSEDEYPEVPYKEGYYGSWDIPSVEEITNDMTVTATYVRNNTTLAVELVRMSNQSALLVDGEFKEGDNLTSTLCVNQADALPDVVEYWDIQIPDDGKSSHMIRYIKPDKLEETPDIYVLNTSNGNGEWELISSENISNMGSYETFYVEGNNVKLQMVKSGKQKRKDKIKGILWKVALVIGALALIFVLALVKKGRSILKRKVRKQAKELKKKAETREPAIKFIEETDLIDEESKIDENDSEDKESIEDNK